MARGPVSRPLREIFIARVIAIKLVQQERVAVTEKHVADFFESGRVPGQIGTYLWPLHGAPEAVPSRAARVAARWGCRDWEGATVEASGGLRGVSPRCPNSRQKCCGIFVGFCGAHAHTIHSMSR